MVKRTLDRRIGCICADGTVEDTQVCAISGREVSAGMVRFVLDKDNEGNSYYFRVYAGRQRDVTDAFKKEMSALIPRTKTVKKVSDS
jgi:hypothetical protein